MHFEFTFVDGVREGSGCILWPVSVQVSHAVGFSHCFLIRLRQRSVDHLTVGLLLGFLFYSLDLRVYFYASTTLF